MYFIYYYIILYDCCMIIFLSDCLCFLIISSVNNNFISVLLKRGRERYKIEEWRSYYIDLVSNNLIYIGIVKRERESTEMYIN